MKTRSDFTKLRIVPALFIGAAVVGCGGDSEPVPVSAKEFPEVQQKQQDILKREYGPGAGKTSSRKS